MGTTFQIENGDDVFELPTVISNYDGQVAGIDAQIIAAGVGYQFSYAASVPSYDTSGSIPDVVYDLMNGYIARGFICEYDGDAGTLTIQWDHPEMNWQDLRNITRAFPGLIPNLGAGFTAAQIYLCLTNGNDMRQISNYDLYGQIQQSIGKAAVLGDTNITFGFPGVPTNSILNLYAEIFTNLNNAGFGVAYSTGMQSFVISWDAGTAMQPMQAGEVTALAALH